MTDMNDRELMLKMKMEILITKRETLIAQNKLSKERTGSTQYGENSFMEIAKEMVELKKQYTGL